MLNLFRLAGEFFYVFAAYECGRGFLKKKKVFRHFVSHFRRMFGIIPTDTNDLRRGYRWDQLYVAKLISLIAWRIVFDDRNAVAVDRPSERIGSGLKSTYLHLFFTTVQFQTLF